MPSSTADALSTSSGSSAKSDPLGAINSFSPSSLLLDSKLFASSAQSNVSINNNNNNSNLNNHNQALSGTQTGSSPPLNSAISNSLSNSADSPNGRPSTPPEQLIHTRYLRDFRVGQCPLFLQHKCTHHKPFTCFYWHFQNQRRRRPLRRKDGTFNYSPDNYCTKYDETTGTCPDGDDCPLLHRTAGDTERRYHLRYYKTGICVYETDSNGYCVKNGVHCAFAHGVGDLRTAQYDAHEIALHSADEQENNLNAINGGGVDKDRGALTEDPRWNDSTFVLANYKTELCKKPPRLCRQGYACPQFHNSKDRRRSPRLYKYRSTPCPHVKQSDEWGDPSHCEAGDACNYCHTRTEQQFHPEIYKSSRCNDMQQTNFCPRGPFCAFAHNEQEINADREIVMDAGADLANMLSAALSNGYSDKAALDGSTNSSHSNGGNGNGGMGNNSGQLPSSRGGSGFGATNNQFGSIGSLGSLGPQFMAGSVPNHFGLNDYGCIGGSASPLQALHLNSASSAFHRGNSPPTLNGNTTSNALGPIARPRSFSSSHTSNLHAALASRESLLNTYLKRQQQLNQQLAQQQQQQVPARKVSTPSALFGNSSVGPGSNQLNSSGFNSIGNLASHSSVGQLNGQTNANSSGGSFFSNGLDTVESVVGSALDDLDEFQLEASIEKEFAAQTMGDEQLSLAGSALMARSASTLLGTTAPVNIPGNAQRSSIGNLGSPPIGLAQSPFSRPNQTISSSVGSSLYEFASHGSGISPGQQNNQSISQQMQTQANNNQAYLMEIHRLREELVIIRNKSVKHEEDLKMANQACEYWKKEAEKAKMEKEEFERRNRSDQMFQ